MWWRGATERRGWRIVAALREEAGMTVWRGLRRAVVVGGVCDFGDEGPKSSSSG